ncbi:DNA-binding protein [Dyadobacter psychrophilus]|uniref:Helix-turn-helix domain-containing protein n=1 Tax=Dyadobacter psychrophilus TaxID=651661 RepID=A0A1T5EUQ0_9BACT|nr:DNA-binding protein [Dyadobacter psychrophilus]SKB87677.1 hypothetical protein SAMN05660293_02788 [Dyadobacter psychrophilus]
MVKEEKKSEKNAAVYANQLVTLADLEKCKDQMLEQLRIMLKPSSAAQTKQWLKSREVRKLLDISPGKLHQLRANRQLGYMRIGGGDLL